MAKLEKYREYIKQLLTAYSQHEKSDSWVELQTIFDSEHDHYQLVYVGWYKDKRVFVQILHLDIKDEKIWLQLNTTEDDITLDLMELGIAKDDIVLGFHSPDMRQFTEFAVG